MNVTENLTDCSLGFSDYGRCSDCKTELENDEDGYKLILSNKCMYNQETRLATFRICRMASMPSHVCSAIGETSNKLIINTHLDEWRRVTHENSGEKAKLTHENSGGKAELKLNIDPAWENSNGVTSADMAIWAMNNLISWLEKMGDAKTAAISVGAIRGMLMKLPPKNPKDIIFAFSPNTELSDEMGLIFNREVLGIEMGNNISNLSDTVDIHYRDVDKVKKNGNCQSW
ncbi:uncharacterized protein LOC130125985 [Lampris incognitus]|uniref:uncharacterized protein LOC130125985 n=1 Tax=Lampris incognitus TaxID=2546036 RepID=UPI0024B51EE9|nr:uncharacterized protein LOC130125985 [Lampris incognitus]